MHSLTIPEHLQYIWDWWNELRGAEVLSFTEILSWAQLTGVYIDREEAKALRHLDILHRRLTERE